MYHFIHVSVLALLVSSLGVGAVPLNINLGAYSPALVVGDGEISFGGAEAGGESSAKSAAQLMETLSTGAVSAAGGNGATDPQGARVITPDATAPAPAAEAPAPDTTSEAAAPETTTAEPEARSAIRKKVLAPPLAKRGSSEADDALKRDLQGFRESLNFAKEAMKNQPEVELGTGEGGSGVGVIVNPGLNVPADSAAAGRAPAAEKRGMGSEGGKQGITLLAIAEI